MGDGAAFGRLQPLAPRQHGVGDAMLGVSSELLCTALVRAAERRVGSFKSHILEKTAWAFAVVNVYSDALFGPVFAHHRFESVPWSDWLHQLHQWVVWHRELELPRPLSVAFRQRCLINFTIAPIALSYMRSDVVAALAECNTCPLEDVVLDEGYTVHALSQLEGRRFIKKDDAPNQFKWGRGSPHGVALPKKTGIAS